PAFGKAEVKEGRKRSQFSGKWQAAYVNQLLNDKRVTGEFQPRTADRKPAGEGIPDYYPVIITREEFALARSGREQRKHERATRQRRHINVFKSLLVHARDGEALVLHNKGKASAPQLVYINMAGRAGRGTCYTIPAVGFDDAVLDLLKELTVEDVQP